MSGIAEVLLNLGYEISGSDLKENDATRRLRSLGAEVRIGHNASNLADALSVVVISTAVNFSNPEVLAAKARQIPGDSAGRDARGAHAHEIRHRGGGKPRQDHHHLDDRPRADARRRWTRPWSSADGCGRWPATRRWGGATSWWRRPDESDGTFLLLSPTVAVVTNIDREHIEFYGTLIGPGRRVSASSSTRCPSTGSPCSASTIRRCAPCCRA